MSDPNVSLDSQFTRIAVQQHVMDHAMSLDAPSANQVAAIQEEGLLDGLKHLSTEAAVHGLAELLEGAAAAGAAVSAGMTLYVLTSGWNRAWEEGEALNHAHQRDAVTLAIIEAGAAALPAGYVSKMMNEYKDVAGKGGADKVLTAAMASGKWDELKEQAEASIKAGRDVAGKAKITTPEALAARLQADPAFAARYHADTAFRVGVQSVVYYGRA
jgi:hypothetical protein